MCAALLGPASPAAAAPKLTIEDFSRPASAWRKAGGLSFAPTVVGGDPALAIERRQRSRGWSGAVARPLPGTEAAVSFDLGLAPGTEAGLLGGGDFAQPPIVIRRAARALKVRAGGRTFTVKARRGGALHHVEAVIGEGLKLSIDGKPIDPPVKPGRTFTLQLRTGRATIDSFVASATDDRRLLLLHRLAALHAITPLGRSPLGVGADGRFRFHSGWTRGFWPGALWQAADLTPTSGIFGRWALDATLANFGAERSDTHDLGFMYGRSSVAAYERLCAGASPQAAPRTCAKLRRSALTAADSLVALARTNQAAGMIPTRSRSLCRGCATLGEADTIIDSMMNLSLLFWAAGESPERAAYSDVAVRHAYGVSAHLVRPDGSTAQSVHTNRADGAVLGVHTHQGASDTSTWARGQSWAIYGFADTALRARSPELLGVAERTAEFVAARDPAGAVPPYDYDAGPGAPSDTSAGVIAAAGMLRLEEACRTLGRCPGRGRRWGDLGERLIDSSLAAARSDPPLGRLDGQVFSLGGSQTWDDRGEFVFGLDFGLEAVRRAGDR